MFIVFIQASLFCFLFLPGSLLQETYFFNLDWFKQPFTERVTVFVLLKVFLLSYDLNTVCMIRMQKVRTTFETGSRISKSFQFNLCRPSTRLPGYCNWRCNEKKLKLKLLRTWSYTQVVIFWLHLEKVVFKLENVISGMTLKIWSISALKYWVQEPENSAVE